MCGDELLISLIQIRQTGIVQRVFPVLVMTVDSVSFMQCFPFGLQKKLVEVVCNTEKNCNFVLGVRIDVLFVYY